MAASSGSKQINVILTELRNLTSKIVASLALDCTANFIEDTPVDTGWARANWVPTIGRPSDSPLGDAAGAKTGVLPTSEQSSAVAAVAASYSLEKGAIYISNNVPYIQQLNDGHSNQAPAGFVEAGIDRAVHQNLQFNNLKSPQVGER